MGRRRGQVLATVLAAAVAGYVPDATAQAGEDAFPPFVLNVSDLTGDGVTDVVAGQARVSDPAEMLVRIVDGASGRAVHEAVVHDLVFPVETVALGDATGVVIAGRLADGPLDPTGASLRVTVVDGTGAERWARVLTAQTVVPDLLPTYRRPALRGVLRRAGAPSLVLVEWTTRVEAGAGRLTRTEAELLDAATGETVATLGPYDTVEDHAELRPVPGDGADAFGVLTMPATQDAGPGTLALHDVATGAARWTTALRAGRDTEVVRLAGSGVLSVTSYADDAIGVQLLDPATGERLADRPRGAWTVPADGTGAAGRLRTRYFTDGDGPNGYAVQLLDLAGRVLRTASFAVGNADTFGSRFSAMDEAGDVDGDGWLDLLAHVAYSVPGRPTAYDDRVVDGRTLASRTVPRDVQTLVWTGAGSAAVDGRGDDVYVTAGRAATVRDGRTLRPLLRVSSAERVGAMFGVRDGAARCADVVVATFDADDFALTRIGPRGDVRWSTRPGAVRVRAVAGTAGCETKTPPAGDGTPRPRPRIPATGGLPAMAFATVCAAVAALSARRARTG